MPEGGSACSSRSIKKEDDSSQSSTCMVDTTTRGCPEEAAAWRGQRPALREWGGQWGRLGAAAAFASWSTWDPDRKAPQGSLKDRGRLDDPPSASGVQSVTQQAASPPSGQGLDLHCYSCLWSQAAIHILTELKFGDSGHVVPPLYQPHSRCSAATRAHGCLSRSADSGHFIFAGRSPGGCRGRGSRSARGSNPGSTPSRRWA